MNNRIVKTGMQKARLVGQEVEHQYDELPFIIAGLGFRYENFMIRVKRGARISPHQGYQARACAPSWEDLATAAVLRPAGPRPTMLQLLRLL